MRADPPALSVIVTAVVAAPAATEEGLKEAVTPVGNPLTDSVTG
jgi:hypothetical protein